VAPQPPEPGEILTPKDLAQGLDRKEEAGGTGLPLRALGTHSPPGHNAVQVEMLSQPLSPSMEHRRDAKLRA
jgi:hypothetical protein